MATKMSSSPGRRLPNVPGRAREPVPSSSPFTTPTKRPRRDEEHEEDEEVYEWDPSDDEQRRVRKPGPGGSSGKGKRAMTREEAAEDDKLWDEIDSFDPTTPTKKAAFSFSSAPVKSSSSQPTPAGKHLPSVAMAASTTPKSQTTASFATALPMTPPRTAVTKDIHHTPAATPASTPVVPPKPSFGSPPSASQAQLATGAQDPLSLLSSFSSDFLQPLRSALERQDRQLRAALKARDAKDRALKERTDEVKGVKAEMEKLQARVRVLEEEREEWIVRRGG